MKIVAFGDSITEGVIGVTPEQNWLKLLGSKLIWEAHIYSYQYLWVLSAGTLDKADNVMQRFSVFQCWW